MATLIALDAVDAVSRLDPELPPREQELRRIYVSPKLRLWIEVELGGLVSDWNLQLTPEEQLAEYFEVFCSGSPITVEHQLKPIQHVGDGVWYLKTSDLRVFGWFPEKDCFVGVVAKLATFAKKHQLYHGLAGEVVQFRDTLDLDPPKFVPGGDPNDVISNFSYP